MALNEEIEKTYVDNLVDYVEVNRKEPVNNGMLLLLPKEELEDEASPITASIKCRGSRGGEFYNYSGCGNTFNCNHPIVRQFIVDSLRYWVTKMHVDGFRFDPASITTRGSSLFDAINVYGNQVEDDLLTTGSPLTNPSLIDMISNDPILRGVGIYLPCYDILCNYMEEYSSQNAASMTHCITCYPIELTRCWCQACWQYSVEYLLSSILDSDVTDIVAAAVLSGNRNFEGRVHPLTRANYLASPPLVVAYALVGTSVYYQGINRARVEQMEDRLKEDILLEAARYGNKILVTDELPDGQMVDQWEPVTPTLSKHHYRVYLEIQTRKFLVDYERIPATDEKSPKEHDFDTLVDRISRADLKTEIIFNYQMGHGRTTTGMVTATLIYLNRIGASG
ncbi:hypothetical protein Lser_V15G22256 [Lactuca serriola]